MRQLRGAHALLDLARGDGGRAQLHIVIVIVLLLLVDAGRDGVAVEQDLVADQIVLEPADLMIDVQHIVLVFEAGLLEGELLGRDFQLQRRIGQDDQRLALLHHRAVLDQHLFHRAALGGGEIIGDQRRHRAAHGDEILERAFGHRADGELVDSARDRRCRRDPTAPIPRRRPTNAQTAAGIA